MKRHLMHELIDWKNRPDRKPLLLQGARQVGKTWLVKEFGAEEFPDCIYINFERQSDLKAVFDRTLDPKKLLQALTAAEGRPTAGKDTLIIFDEVQEEPRALTSLKYFQEEMPGQPVIATGSFMGIALHAGTSFPVGKIDIKTLYPMNFREFLHAMGYGRLAELIEEGDPEEIRPLSPVYKELLRSYFLTGGMPEAVSEFVGTGDYVRTREIQNRILDNYRLDFSKHASPQLVNRLNQVWDSIPAQLSKENRKFIFGHIAKGARSKDFELALQWLGDCGLINMIHRVSKAGIPLKAYEEMGAFKVFLNDVGLLGAMGELPVSAVVQEDGPFEEFKGALAEQYVLQQLISDVKVRPYYYSADNSRCEIDFIAQIGGQIIPIEVKAAENLQAKSLKAFVEKHPGTKGIRISMSDYRDQENLTNMPMYAFTGMLGKKAGGYK